MCLSELAVIRRDEGLRLVSVFIYLWEVFIHLEERGVQVQWRTDVYVQLSSIKRKISTEKCNEKFD